MADFEATDALYDKGFDLNQVKENSEINYQRKRLSNLADRRSRILNQSHLDVILDEKLKVIFLDFIEDRSSNT